MIERGTQYLEDAIEQLREQRGRVAQDTVLLEAIISTCSGIARRAPSASVLRLAVGLRATAVSLYSRPYESANANQLLEECIAKLELELKLQFPRR
jgi:hypothetical protein